MKKIFSFLTVLLFAGSMMAANYVKVTAEPTDWSGKYLVVYESSETKAFVFNGKDEVSDYVEATIADGAISSTELSDYEVTVAEMDGGYSLYVGGKYIYGKSGSNGITFGDAAVLNSIEYSTDKTVVTSNSVSLQFNSTSGQTRFRYFKSAQKAIQLYKLAEGGEEEGPTYTVAGSPTTAFGSSWDEKDTKNDMVKQEDGSYKWEKAGLELAAGDIEFKVVKDHDWNNGANAWPAANYILPIAESGVYTITITFEPENENEISAVATKTADLVVLPKVVLHGNFTGSWVDTEEFVAAEDKKTASLELTLGEGEFEFGFKFDGSWKANAATLDREHPTTSLATGDGNMKLVADEAGKYTFVYTFETQAVEVTFPAKRITCDAVYSLAKNDEVALKDVTVTYVNGKNVYVKDATGSMLLFLPAAGSWKAGDVLSGVAGVVDIYNGLYEVKPSAAQVAAVVVTPGEAPEPVELTGAPVAADVNKYVIIKGVSVSAAAFPSSKNLDATIGEETFVLRNQFNASVAFDTEKKYDITGAVAIYTKNDETTVQLYFISAEEVVDPRLKGAYKIGGEGADFASLYDAFVAVNTIGVRGDVTFQVAADLTEAKNVAIRNTSDFTVTLTVDAAVDRKITFTQAADNGGPSGNLCIGPDHTSNIAHATAATASGNVVLDGSFEGDGQRHLTLEATKDVEKYNGPVLIYGNVSNVIVKNMRLVQYNSGSSNYGITIRTRNASADVPKNILIENNYIENATNNTYGQGLYFQRNGTATASPKDVQIIGNEFVAMTRGIFMQATNGTTIKNNIFRVNQTSAGMNSFGIYGNSNVEGKILVEGNQFLLLGTKATASGTGITAIQNESAGDWTVVNNVITGFAANADAPADIILKGIKTTNKATSFNIWHNTIVMPEQEKLTTTNANGIVFIDAANTTSVANNLLISQLQTAQFTFIANAGENCVNNVVSFVGEIEGLESANIQLDETFKPKENKNVLWVDPLPSVDEDIWGIERGAAKVTVGAVELPEGPTAIGNIELREGVQKIFRNGEVLIIKDGKTYNMMGQIVK